MTMFWQFALWLVLVPSVLWGLFSTYSWWARSRLVKPRPALPDVIAAARPIDPDNPPSWKVYGPKKGSPARSCACHPGRRLEPGQRVLWWPVPDSGGGVEVYCEQGVEVDK